MAETQKPQKPQKLSSLQVASFVADGALRWRAAVPRHRSAPPPAARPPRGRGVRSPVCSATGQR
jgi:hypothetical protein